jgi:hypothetical protein
VVGERPKVIVLFPVYQRGRVIAERSAYLDLISHGQQYSGMVIARDSRRDLALIQLVQPIPKGAQAIQLSREIAMPGQRVHSVGNPGGSGALWLYTSGTVRQVYHKKWQARTSDGIMNLDAQVVETDSATNQGDSGGPLVNDAGELIGVTQGAAKDAQLMSTFIDLSEVRVLLRSQKIILPLAPAVVSTENSEPAKPQDTHSATAEEGPNEKAEHDAAYKLRLAKRLAADGVLDKARVRYQEIVDTFPNTKAAEEARHLLEKDK